jgi:cytochrome P450
MLEHHLNLNDPNFIRDPYPKLEELRESSSVFFDPVWKKLFFTRYEDIAALLKDRRLGRSITHILSRDELGWPPANPRQKPFDDFQALHMLDREPPDHTRLRSLVQRAFTQSRVENLRSRIEGIVNGMLDRLEARASFDVHSDLAEPLPVLVIAELLGVPEAFRSKLRPWSASIVKLYELGYGELEMEAASNAVLEFSQMLRELVEARRLEPQDDLISALVAVEEQGEKLTEDELIANCILFLNAGHEATVNGTTSAVQALCRNPQVLEQLALEAQTQANTSSLFKTAIEEFLRYDTPLPMFERWVLEDIEFQSSIGTIKLERGSEVALMYASGNRDPRKFSLANELVLDRADNAHLTFGLGTHYCIGAPLARLEMQVAIHTLLKRFPKLSLEREPEYGAGFVIRGLKSLVVKTG